MVLFLFMLYTVCYESYCISTLCILLYSCISVFCIISCFSEFSIVYHGAVSLDALYSMLWIILYIHTLYSLILLYLHFPVSLIFSTMYFCIPVSLQHRERVNKRVNILIPPPSDIPAYNQGLPNNNKNNHIIYLIHLIIFQVYSIVIPPPLLII